MKHLVKDSRFRLIICANIASAIGSGITMIAIPWLLVSSNDGNTIFGYITIAMTLINFLITPFIGHLIDKTSRKRLLITSKIISLVSLLLFAAIGFAGVPYEVWHYMIIYMIGSLYYTIFYPTMFALNQEIFNKNQYKSLNGIMEVQGQLSSMIAGAIASVLLTQWELQTILSLDALSFVAAIILFLRIPYVRIKENQSTSVAPSKAMEGVHYMMKRPSMFMFLLFSTMPFIGVMITNYLFPVYLSDVLKTSAGVYGIQGMVYGFGAIIAGLIVPLIAQKLGDGKTIIYAVITYTVAISFILLASIPFYLALMFFIALGNSGARVARNSFLMDQVPNALIGRVDSLFRTFGLLLRIGLLALFTGMVSSGLIMYCFILLSLLMIAASISVTLSWKKGFELVNEEQLTPVLHSN